MSLLCLLDKEQLRVAFETSSLPYKIDSQNLLYDAGIQNSGAPDKPRRQVGWWRWEGRYKGEGPYVYLWLIHLDMGTNTIL